ncbi:MAG: PQQ-binding-like beta-propeller repeat protein [Pirellulaceae bacterium]
MAQLAGPNGNGVADVANPPTVWSESKNIRWKTEVPGKGSGTPAVWENKIIVLTAIAKPGTEAEDDSVTEPPQNQGRPGHGRGRGQGRGAPKTEHDFAAICYDLNNGNETWKTVVASAVPHESGHQTNTFASASPIVDGEHIFAFFGSQGLHCLDMDGNVVWSKDMGKMQTRNQFGEGRFTFLTRRHPRCSLGPRRPIVCRCTFGQRWK